MARTLIGIDIGTTSVKAVMIDLAGRRLAGFAAPYPTRRPGPGRVEQDPADWLALVTAALSGFAAYADRGQVQAVGFAGQVNTHVFADAGHAPLCPALVWQDQRAAAAGAALEAGIAAGDKLAWLGAAIPLDASHALSRMAWMAAHHPDLWQRTVQLMAPKDWVIARLTAVVLADPVASIGLVGPDLRYAAPLLARVPGAAARLAALADPLSVAGPLLQGALAGTPVVLGTMDAWASLFGVGVARPGQAMYLSGTSEVLAMVSPRRIAVPGVITFPDWAGITLHAGPTQAGGGSLDWLARLTGRGVAELCDLAAPVGPATPLFLPHLEGERAPVWDAAARAVFAGLSGATGVADMAASVMEGVAFSARWAFEAVEAAGGARADEIRLGGGGATSDRWCQTRADGFGRPLLRMRGGDAGAVGAAVMAGVGCGALPGLEVAAAQLVLPDRLFLPDPAAAGLAEARFQVWQDLYRQVRPVHAALAGLA